MDGKHHVEEIMYREAVTRRQLSLVLKYYRDNIVTVYHYYRMELKTNDLRHR